MESKMAGQIVISESTDPRAKWYVVHTASGHEVRVAETLRQRVESMGLTGNVFELLVPTQDRVVIRGGKKATIKEKIFPGYLLVKMAMDDATWLAVRTTPGVTGFVGVGAKPTPISDKEVSTILQTTEEDKPKFQTPYSVGDVVKITSGTFADFIGTVESIDVAKGKMRVLVTFFERETPVEIDFLQVTKEL